MKPWIFESEWESVYSSSFNEQSNRHWKTNNFNYHIFPWSHLNIYILIIFSDVTPHPFKPFYSERISSIKNLIQLDKNITRKAAGVCSRVSVKKLVKL